MPIVSRADKIRTERSATARERPVYSAATLAGQRTIERGDVLCVESAVGAADVEAQYFVGRLAAVYEYNGDYYARFYALDGAETGPKHPVGEVEPVPDDLRDEYETAEKPHVTITKYVDGETRVV